jgi:hypothetical protein
MDLNKLFQSKIVKGLLIGLAAVLILLVGFKLGLVVGERKAEFSGQWGENYHRNFGGPKRGFMQEFGDREFIDASGTFGQILKIDGNTLTVKGKDDVEKIILVTDKTVINRLRDKISLADLAANDSIVTIGEPNADGQIEAKLIRVMPAQQPMPAPTPDFIQQPNR